MRIAHEWLEELLGPLPSVDEVCHILTMQGLEVEGVEMCGEGLLGTEIVRIRSLTPHGQHLKIVDLETLSGDERVVTGAPNVAPGQMVVWAKPGTSLPDGRVLQAAEFLGVMSHGMLLSADEMGLGEDRDGILILPEDAPLGLDAAEYLSLPRPVYDISLTTSFASHCQSALGVARELAARLGRHVAAHKPAAVEDEGAGIPVSVSDDAICPVYLGARFVRVGETTTPLYMRLRLLTSGMRCVEPFVDLTNYVMLEIGQPLHPFAMDHIEEGILVRPAHPGERMRTLDGVERELDARDIVIADAAGPVALAGVMGSERAEMTPDTQEVFLEAAIFDPRRIGRTSRREGLRSEAARRFMYPMDPTLPWRAVERMRALAREVGYESAPGLSASAAPPAEPDEITVSAERVRRLLGLALSAKEQAAALERLDFSVRLSDDRLNVRPPSHRPDVRIGADVVEEVLRGVGIERLSEELPALGEAQMEPPRYGWRQEMLEAFLRVGYRQTMSYSFEDPELAAVLGNRDPVRLQNPLAPDAAALRTTLLGGLIVALRRNIAHGTHEVALVEAGTVFWSQGGAMQEEMRAAVLLHDPGDRASRFSFEPADFFSFKGDVMAALGSLHVADARVEPSDDERLHPGRQASVIAGGREIGLFGELHPALAQRLSLPPGVLLGEFALDVMRESAGRGTVRPLPRYPALWRDLAVVLPAAVRYVDVETTARSAAGTLLEDISLFDVYEGGVGRPVSEGSVSLALRIVLRSPERTLSEHDAEETLGRVLDALAKSFGARLR